MTRCVAPFARLVVLWCAADSALAQDADPGQEQAARLFEHGVAAAATGDYTTAIFAFERSYRLFAHPGTLKNLAVYQDQAGRLADAYRSWSEFLERFGDAVSEASRREAEQRIETLEAVLARVTIEATVPGALLFLDGHEIGRAPLAEPLHVEAGPHVFEARLEGHREARFSTLLMERANPIVRLELLPIDTPSPTLRIDSATPGAVVRIDGGPAQPLPFIGTVDPGEHHVALSAPDSVGITRVVAVPPTGETVVAIDLMPVSTPVEPVPEEGGFWDGPWPWVIGGALVLGAATATAVVLWPEGSPEGDHFITFR